MRHAVNWYHSVLIETIRRLSTNLWGPARVCGNCARVTVKPEVNCCYQGHSMAWFEANPECSVRNKTMMMQNSRTVTRSVNAHEEAREKKVRKPLHEGTKLN
jgi:hypothetical protein